jgi:hypothetical protein
MRRLRLIAPLAAVAAALALPALAAATPEDVIKDCSDDGIFQRHHSAADLNEAYGQLPTDIREYTDCQAMIRAELAKLGGGGSPGGGLGGGTGATGTGAGGTGAGPGGAKPAVTPSGAAGAPADVGALGRELADVKKRKPSIALAGGPLTPAASGLNHVASAANALPGSLLVAILALMLLCAAGGIAAAWRRWPALMRAPLRLIRR